MINEITIALNTIVFILLLFLPITTKCVQHRTGVPYNEINALGNQFGGKPTWKRKNYPHIADYHQSSYSRIPGQKISNEDVRIDPVLPGYCVSIMPLSDRLSRGLANTLYILVVPSAITTFDVYRLLSIASVLTIRTGAPAIRAKVLAKVLYYRHSEITILLNNPNYLINYGLAGAERIRNETIEFKLS